jgi:NAD+ kinase
VKPGAIGVVVHPRRDSRAMIGCVVAWADRHGKEVRGLEEARDLMPPSVRTVPEEELAVGAGLVIGLGGDGTILRALKLATEHEVPVLGVNLGRLAFLAEVNLDELPGALDAIDRDEHWIEERAVMTVTGTCCPTLFTAFNDSALSRIPGNGPAAIAVEVEDEIFARYTADALVIATPTGSTAYSLSAGGPILSPESGALVITPICPHVLTNRSIIVGADAVIEVETTERDNPIFLTVDGRDLLRVEFGSVITIQRSSRVLPLAALPGVSFFSVVRQKLKWSGSNI